MSGPWRSRTRCPTVSFGGDEDENIRHLVHLHSCGLQCSCPSPATAGTSTSMCRPRHMLLLPPLRPHRTLVTALSAMTGAGAGHPRLPRLPLEKPTAPLTTTGDPASHPSRLRRRASRRRGLAIAVLHRAAAGRACARRVRLVAAAVCLTEPEKSLLNKSCFILHNRNPRLLPKLTRRRCRSSWRCPRPRRRARRPAPPPLRWFPGYAC